jgi:hypothetical protein
MCHRPSPACHYRPFQGPRPRSTLETHPTPLQRADLQAQGAGQSVLCHNYRPLRHNSLPTGQRDPSEFPYGTKKLGFTFCHNIRPKVQFATYGLPKNLARFFVKKSALFACFSCSHGRFYVAKWPGYVTNRFHRGFFAAFYYFIDYFISYFKVNDKGTKRNKKPLLPYSIAVIILPLARLYGEVARLYDKAQHAPWLIP